MKFAAVGDNVLIKSEPPHKQPFLAVIKEIHEPSVNGRGERAQNMVVNWYYRPNEVWGGRKGFHGTMEVFESDHCDTCDVSTLISHCEVLSLDDYLNSDYLTNQTFFTRYFYSASKREFKPDRVMVYCSCQLPFNPDQPMVMCTGCEEWYHLACLGIQGASEDKLAGFVCEHCHKRDDRPPGKRPKLETQHPRQQQPNCRPP
ncbi:hypothetical protein N2152v2_002151 [Parachlorella kessleri]